MTQPLRVYLEAMTKYAEAMDDLSDGFGRTRQLLVDADVTRDSFGMLPESRDAAEVYAQRTSDGLDVLRAGEDVFSELAIGFREMRDGYRTDDKATADQLGGTR